MNATMSLEKVKHYPVMLDQVLSIISPQHGGSFIDCTFGGGGYSEAILKFPNTKVFAIDRDECTKKHAENLTKKFPSRFSFFKDKFSNLDKVIDPNLNPKAVIFDLGLSSFQLADHNRGFSFKSKKSLSMQMGINKYSAYQVVNTLDSKVLGNIFKILGEEKEGKIIANKIVNYRRKKLIKTAEELSKIICSTKRQNKKFKTNPSTKAFQAIRSLVNEELSELIQGLIAATKILKKGGIIVVITFQSLEDRIVKYFFNSYSDQKKNPSRYLPIDKTEPSLFSIISKKVIVPHKKEIKENNSSRSAKLRYGLRNNNLFYKPKEFIKKFSFYSDLEEVVL